MFIKSFRRKFALLMLVLMLSACSHSPSNDSTSNSNGRYSMANDSGVLESIDLSSVLPVVPVVENRTLAGNKNPYTVNGETYHLMESELGYVETGMASWYGRKFHGHLTSNGEVYDMFQLSAAHKTLPIPGYLRVTNLDNNKSIVVRVNDRGPFHSGRVVDLSYAAAVMLDYADKGTARVRVEALVPSQEARGAGGIGSIGGIGVGSTNSSITRRGLEAATTSPASVTAYATDSVFNDVVTERRLIDEDLGQEYLQVGAFSNLLAAQNIKSQLSQISPVPVFINSDLQQGSTNQLHRVRLGPVDETIGMESLIQLITSAGFAEPFRVRQ